jgi:hypothetical protein
MRWLLDKRLLNGQLSLAAALLALALGILCGVTMLGSSIAQTPCSAHHGKHKSARCQHRAKPKPQAQPCSAGAGQRRLAVRVSGNELVDGSGCPLRLVGVNRSGSEYSCVQGRGIFDGPTDAASIEAMRSWDINVVRVPLNEDCWLGINGVQPAYSGAAYRQAIKGFV